MGFFDSIGKFFGGIIGAVVSPVVSLIGGIVGGIKDVFGGGEPSAPSPSSPAPMPSETYQSSNSKSVIACLDGMEKPLSFEALKQQLASTDDQAEKNAILQENQRRQNAVNEMMAMMSNMSKSDHDTKMAIINNMRV